VIVLLAKLFPNVVSNARLETLAVYKHISLDGDLKAKYQAIMKQVEL
jgi:hypothetical protein